MSARAWMRGPAQAAPAVPLPRWADRVLPWLLALFGLLLPFSVAGTSLLLLVLLLLALATPRPLWRAQPWREPVVALGLLLVAYVALHTLAMGGWTAETRGALSRYKELLFLPVLYALFLACSARELFFRGLLAGSAGYALAHWGALFSERLEAAVAMRYIAAGFIFAVMAFLLLQRARGSGRPWAWRAGAGFFALTVLFATGGRTGQLALLVLLAWAAWTHSPRRFRLWAALGIALAFLALALASPRVQTRIAETRAALQEVPQPPFSSSEIRIELVRHGWTLAREHFLLGGGYTRYAQLHQDAVRRAYGDDPVRRSLVDAYWARTDNPHSEYLMHLAGGGLPALALFLAWLAAPLVRRDAAGRRSPELAGLVLAFALGCLFNSMLMDFVEGHFYAAVLAWLLARHAAHAPPA